MRTSSDYHFEYDYVIHPVTAGTVSNHHTQGELKVRLDEYGKHGWEVVSVEICPPGMLVWMKRWRRRDPV